jgi:hypothetical protein
MERQKRVVTKPPLDELWSATADFSNAHRHAAMTHDELTQLLRLGPAWFVVANVGHSLEWIDLSKCYEFWKREVKPHFASAVTRIYLDAFPDGYAYSAVRWTTELTDPVVVLEKHH